MNLLGIWLARFRRSNLAPAPLSNSPLEAAPDSGLDDLKTRLNHWSQFWSSENESSTHSEAQQVVAERLGRWMERCFGQHVRSSLPGATSQISMASTTPILTAFLGRRATRELSRRILQDI